VVQSKKDNQEVARLVKEIDTNLLYQRFGHPSRSQMKHVMKQMGLSYDSEEITNICRGCKIYIQAKAAKWQNQSTVPRASRPLKQVYMDFWGLYTKTTNKDR
jgi:hypothetical protein